MSNDFNVQIPTTDFLKVQIPTGWTPKPDVFVIAATDAGAELLPSIVKRLILDGWNTRYSHRNRITRNIPDLLEEAHQSGAVRALILDDGVQRGRANLKMLQEQGRERRVSLDNPMAPELEDKAESELEDKTERDPHFHWFDGIMMVPGEDCERRVVVWRKEVSEECLHRGCTECHGSGVKEDGTSCIHTNSCSCPTCNEA